jgi:hypothetical protein
MTPLAHAASDLQESITLSPVSQDYKIDAGKEVSDELTVINDGKLAYDFIVYSRPYSVQSEQYDPDFTKVKSNTDVYQWVRLPQTKYHIEPNQTIKVPYTLSVPSTAAPGGHYGVIFAETQPVPQTSGNSVVRKKRVGTIIYANVNGSYINKGEFVDSSIPFWQLQPPMNAYVRVKNTGNSDFRDNVRYVVKDVFGNVKYDASKAFPVLPQTTRKITLSWDKSPWFGLFKVEISQKFLDKEQTTSGYVLMMPRFLPVVLLVLILIGGGYGLYHRRKKKQ